MTAIERVYSALDSRWKAQEPMSLDAVARECGITAGAVIDAVKELKLSGRVTFTGHSGSVPELHVIDGAA